MEYLLALLFTMAQDSGAPSKEVAAPSNNMGPKNSGNVEGESERARIERLGRQRPEQLPTAWKEIGFVFSIVMSQALNEYFISGFIILIPTVVQALDIPPEAVTWPSSSFSLVIACCLTPFGRVADIYGGFYVYIAGMAWTTALALVVSFSQNEIMFDICRAIKGLGPAAYLPSGLMLLGSIYRPGPRKNFIFAMYGAMAPLGFYIGIFFAGIVGQFAGWRWFFLIGTIIGSLTTLIAYCSYLRPLVPHARSLLTGRLGQSPSRMTMPSTKTLVSRWIGSAVSAPSLAWYYWSSLLRTLAMHLKGGQRRTST